MHIDEQVKGTIYFVNGDSYSFDSNDIIDDDISILQQATADNSFNIGGTYSSTLNMTIHIPKGLTNSYDIVGSKIALYSKYGSETEFVLRGVFWVTSATRYKEIYTLSCSDAIAWLDDTPYLDENGYNQATNESFNNELYNRLISYIRTLTMDLDIIVGIINETLTGCNVGEIRTDWTEPINEMPPHIDGRNTMGYCVLPMEQTGESATHCPRDYASWLAQIGCGFIVCNYLDGEIPYISIGQFETSPTETLNWKSFEQDTLEIANFNITCYKIYVEVYNGVIGAVSNSNRTLNSIVVDVSGNPFIDGHYWYSLPEGETVDTAPIEDHSCMDILGEMSRFLSQLSIKPFSGTYHGEKRFKLGQCIKIIDENNHEHITILTKIQWNFRGGCELKCSSEDNRVLFDSARRTPSIRAKEQALTKTNYAIKKTENGLQANIDYIDSKFETKLQDANGQTQNLNYWVDCLWASMYGSGDTVDKIRQNTNALKSAIESLGGSVNGWINY